jgi:hypothetical protein
MNCIHWVSSKIPPGTSTRSSSRSSTETSSRLLQKTLLDIQQKLLRVAQLEVFHELFTNLSETSTGFFRRLFGASSGAPTGKLRDLQQDDVRKFFASLIIKNVIKRQRLPKLHSFKV